MPNNVPEEAEEVGEEEMEMSELDPVYNSEPDCRFQVCEQRMDEEGNLVLEIEEKTDSASSSSVKPSPAKQMVTLRWGEEKEVAPATKTKRKESGRLSEKVIDLNLKLEEIIEEITSIPSEILCSLMWLEIYRIDRIGYSVRQMSWIS